MTDNPPAEPHDPYAKQPGQGQGGPAGQPGPPPYGQQAPGQQPPQGGQPPYGQQQPWGQQAPGGGAGYQQAGQPLRPEDEKLWSTLIHVGGILFGFIPALVGYLVLKDRGPFIREHSRQALNFQITMAIAAFVGGLLSIILVGYLLLAAVGIVILVFSILAALAANKGEYYKYPLTIEFIKA